MAFNLFGRSKREFNNRGEYDANVEYFRNDLVRFVLSGTARVWILMADSSTGTAPGNGANNPWAQFVSTIVTGPVGAQGLPAPEPQVEYSDDGTTFRSNYVDGDNFRRVSYDDGATFVTERIRGPIGPQGNTPDVKDGRDGADAKPIVIEFLTNAEEWETRNYTVEDDVAYRLTQDGIPISGNIPIRGIAGRDGLDSNIVFATDDTFSNTSPVGRSIDNKYRFERDGLPVSVTYDIHTDSSPTELTREEINTIANEAAAHRFTDAEKALVATITDRTSIGTAFPSNPERGYFHIFSEDVARGVSYKDRDGTTDLTSANRTDTAWYNGTDWIWLGRLDDTDFLQILQRDFRLISEGLTQKLNTSDFNSARTEINNALMALGTRIDNLPAPPTGNFVTDESLANILQDYAFTYIGIFPRYARLDQLTDNWVIVFPQPRPPFRNANRIEVLLNGVPVSALGIWDPNQLYFRFSMTSRQADNIVSNVSDSDIHLDFVCNFYRDSRDNFVATRNVPIVINRNPAPSGGGTAQLRDAAQTYALIQSLLDYNDLQNKPDIPTLRDADATYALIQSLLNYDDLLNKPDIPTLRDAAATYALIRSLLDYNDLQNKPDIPDAPDLSAIRTQISNLQSSLRSTQTALTTVDGMVQNNISRLGTVETGLTTVDGKFGGNDITLSSNGFITNVNLNRSDTAVVDDVSFSELNLLESEINRYDRVQLYLGIPRSESDGTIIRSTSIMLNVDDWKGLKEVASPTITELQDATTDDNRSLLFGFQDPVPPFPRGNRTIDRINAWIASFRGSDHIIYIGRSNNTDAKVLWAISGVKGRIFARARGYF